MLRQRWPSANSGRRWRYSMPRLRRAPYLLGQRFSVADLYVASILSWARQARVDLSPFAKAEAWLRACHERPAARAARELQRAG